MEKTDEIYGIIFRFDEKKYGFWKNFTLDKEDEKAIMKILSKYKTDGCSVQGTIEEIAFEVGGF